MKDFFKLFAQALHIVYIFLHKMLQIVYVFVLYKFVKSILAANSSPSGLILHIKTALIISSLIGPE